MSKRENDASFQVTERFEILHQLGRGGSGEVFEVFDKEENRRVALKTLRHHDAHGVAHFEEEFSKLRGLEHPNLIQLYELFNEQSRCFFTMELVEGSHFLTYVWNRRQGDPARIFDEPRLRSCLNQLVSVIYQLHCKRIIHRDVKPSNIVVTPEGRLVLLDFGLATEVIAGRQVDGIGAVGTKDYMSPEQSFGLPVGASTDWYSVGVILYQALTGTLPKRQGAWAEGETHNWWEVQPPAALNPKVPPDLNDLAVGLMHVTPKDRFSGREIVDRLGLTDEPALRSDLPGAEWTTAKLGYVGRQSELEALGQAYQRTSAGKTACALILGEPGIGKTSLAKEFIRGLEEDPQNLVLTGRFSLGVSLRFKAFRTIIEDMKEVLNEIVGPRNSRNPTSSVLDESCVLSVETATAVTQTFPALMNVERIAAIVDPRLQISNPQELRAKAYSGVRTLLAGLALDYRVILFLDDLQWADRDSMSLLADLMNPAQSPPLLLIATVRSEHARYMDLSSTLPIRIDLPLKGLSQAEASDLTKSICEYYGVTKDAFRGEEKRLEEAKGHPLFLAELVQYRAQVGSDIGLVGLEEAIWSRILRLEDTARTMLEIICVSVVPLDEEIVAEIAGLDRADWVPALASLLVGSFVQCTRHGREEKVEPYHDRIRETMLANLAPARLKRHHLSLAYELVQSRELIDKEIVVQHLEGAGRDQEAADLARKAAEIASKQLAFGEAAELIATALRLGEYSAGQRLKMQMDLGDALCNAGLGTDAYNIYVEAGKEADATTRLNCHRRAMEQLMLTGHFDEGYKQIDNMLAEIGTSLPRTPKKALLSVLRNRAKLSLRGTGWKKREEHEIPADKLAELDIYAVVAGGLAMMDNVRGADFQTRCLLLALKLGEEKRLSHALAMETIFLASQGGRSVARAKKLLAEARRIAERTEDHFSYWGSCAAAGLVSYFEARFPEAHVALAQSERELRSRSETPTDAMNSSRIFMVSTVRILGRFGQLREAFDDYVWDSRRRGDRFLETSIRLLCSRIFLAGDQMDEAHGNLAEALWIPPEGIYHTIDWYKLVARVELALYQGTALERLDEFESMFDDLNHSMILRVVTVQREALWLRGRLFSSMLQKGNDTGAVLKQLGAIIRKMRRRLTRFPPAKAWSTLLSATVAYHQGDRDSAIAALETGIEAALQCEQSYLAELARLRLGELVGGDEGQAMLREGEACLKEQGVVDPQRMAEVFVPGLIEKR